MKVNCIHGYFKISENVSGEISKFSSLFGLSISRSGDHFTFTDLIDAPEYSLPGGLFLGAPTSEAFAGKPWEVMRENDLVYNFNTGLMVPIASIVQQVQIKTAGNSFISNGLILPGSIMDDGSRVRDYSASFSFDTLRFKYSEVGSD